MYNILTFGELLYDIYDNVPIIGGAPFNYSLQLSRLLNKDDRLRFITALGNDDLANNAMDFIKKENIDCSLIQINKNCETGKATVFLNEKKIPDYIIHENVAWDNIEYTKEIEDALKKEEYDLFYFNILSQRANTSYDTINNIYNNIKAKYRVCDVTFRKNYYTKEKIEKALKFVNILKVNDDELYTIKDIFYPSLEKNNEKILKMLYKDFNIEYIFLTLGKEGAGVLYNNEYILKPSNDIDVVDTVGAGDSFCAALSYGILNGLSVRDTLELASDVSEEMVQLRGGTARYDIEKIKNKFAL